VGDFVASGGCSGGTDGWEVFVVSISVAEYLALCALAIFDERASSGENITRFNYELGRCIATVLALVSQFKEKSVVRSATSSCEMQDRARS
jgi:hypothetical protein